MVATGALSNASPVFKPEIDRHLYALYGLTKEEIAIVEGSQPK